MLDELFQLGLVGDQFAERGSTRGGTEAVAQELCDRNRTSVELFLPIFKMNFPEIVDVALQRGPCRANGGLDCVSTPATISLFK